MDSIYLKIFFEDPFWVGVFECRSIQGYRVARVVFGSEPGNYELAEFILNNYQRLNYSKPTDTQITTKQKISPKRRQRQAAKECQTGIGTKAQQELKKQQEELKICQKTDNKKTRLAAKERKYLLGQLKKKKKQQGH